MADIPKVKRNIGRMIDQGAPEADIDAYVASEGVTAEQLRAAPQSEMGGSQFVRQFGRALVPGYDRMTAAVGAGVDQLTGASGTFGENYERRKAEMFADRERANRNMGASDIAAKTLGYTAGGLGMMGTRMLNPVLSASPTMGEVVKESARVGAPVGMVQSYADSSKEGAERAKDAAMGFIGGGAVGAAVPLIIASAGQVKDAAGRALNRVVGNAPHVRAESARNMQDFNATGVPAGPWVRSGGDPTAEALADSFGGQALRDRASVALRSAEHGLSTRLQQSGSLGSRHDAGEDAQNFIRHQLFERNLPVTDIPTLPQAERQRVAQTPPMMGHREPGNPQYTYRDEFGIGYDVVDQSIPRTLRGPLAVTSKSGGSQNELYTVLEDLRADLRGRGLLRHDDPRVPIFDSPAAPAFRAALEQRLPKEIVETLFSRTPIATQDLRRIRTQIRELGDVPPAQRTLEDVYRQRMERGITNDMYNRIARQGRPQLDTAAQTMRNLDESYARFQEHLIQPLRPVHGETVSPEQALGRLIRAAQGDNQGLLHAYYSVHAAKGSRERATAGLVGEMARGGLGSFVQEYGRLTPEARRLMFTGDARQLGAELDRFHRVARQLLPYTEAVQRGIPGANISRAPNQLAAGSLLLGLQGFLVAMGGQVALSRFMSSPSYVRWITAAPRQISSSQQWKQHVGRLVALARGDAELGEGIIAGATEIFGMRDQVAQQRQSRPQQRQWSPKDVPAWMAPPSQTQPQSVPLVPRSGRQSI